jgi:hypothetical protein
MNFQEMASPVMAFLGICGLRSAHPGIGQVFGFGKAASTDNDRPVEHIGSIKDLLEVRQRIMSSGPFI